MKKIFQGILVLASFVISTVALAQDRTVTGRIVDQDNYDKGRYEI